MATYDLKLNEKFFWDVGSGVKNFEIRKEDDKVFNVGDTLKLHLWSPEYHYMKNVHVGFHTVFKKDISREESETIVATVSYKTDYAQKDNYVVLGLSNIKYIQEE